MNEPAAPPVLATYRLQLHAGFTFDAVREVVPYLVALGITHLYLSPITVAAPGSTHGYDVVDPTRLNPELGGDEAYRALVSEQRRHGLGQVVDIVPNHMGIALGSGNAYWEDVLRHGREAPSARLFDIDWDAEDAGPLEVSPGKVVLPILGDEPERVVAAGGITVLREGEGWLEYGGHRLPLRPGSLDAWDEYRDGVLGLIEQQHYRLAYWRSGKREVNYRRFFAVDELVGLRVEDPEVFDFAHRLVLRLVAEGDIAGLRIDHPDGLRDPEAYLDRLRRRSAEAGVGPPYVIVEKILEDGETLPEGWACDGTTGYDFMNEVTRVLVDPDAEDRFTSIYAAAAGQQGTYAEIGQQSREAVLGGDLGRQYARLAHRLYRHATPAEVGEDAFVEAILALLADLDVYRTYHRAESLDPRASRVVGDALGRAPRTATVPGDALDTAARLLAEPPAGEVREAVISLQQIMPAVQAKGLEDRAFYRYRRLLALNEVGGDPGRFGQTVAAFHRRMVEESLRRPRRMLATATHDHKLGEDVRARLAALSEFPEEWARTVEVAFAAFARVQSGWPRQVHAHDQYLLLQVLAGCHPAGMTQGRESDGDLSGRLGAYLVKALREAGERTGWVDRDAGYEEAVVVLAERALSDAEAGAAIDELLEQIAPAGAVHSLAQVLLKAAGPGVTDTYQGNELWDLSLVDPDNRRAVDFDLRRAVLHELAPVLDDGAEADRVRASVPRVLLPRWRDGAVKAYTLARTLRIRRARPSLFLGGTYEPLDVEGARAGHVIAFRRSAEDGEALVVVPRLVRASVDADRLWTPRWDDTAVRLPADVTARRWRDAFTGVHVPADERLRLDHVLGPFPVALLLAE